MFLDNKIWIGTGQDRVFLLPEMANRHGLIAGATGTGKTITLKVLAESFSDAGVPVFLADIKGDLAGMCMSGVNSESMEKRIAKFKLNEAHFTYKTYPTCFWDVYGEYGHPVRSTISEMGPALLSRLMGLNDIQSSVLNIVFRVADENGWLLLDCKDFKAMVSYVGEHAKELSSEYGNIAPATIGAIIRGVVALEDAGGDVFFGEPALDIMDWIQSDNTGLGMINILHCVKLFQSPLLYSTFLLWMLSELYERLPEQGDSAKPKMVFFFDEAHLLFNDMPKVLLDKIEQVVRLVRSKGIGVYFITQNPTDIPDSILAQLGNRIQHALRAYTPSEQKVVKACAQTFRPNPAFPTEEAITDLGVGEALVSMLDTEGRPGIVERAFILPPQSQMGALDDSIRMQVIAKSAYHTKYTNAVDRESAYEILTKKAALDEKEALAKEKNEENEKAKEKKSKEKAASSKKTKSAFEKAASSAANTVGREVGRSLVRGLMGLLK